MANMPTSFRLNDRARWLLDALVARTGLKVSAVLEQALRHLAREEGIHEPTADDLDEWRKQRTPKQG